MFFIKILYRKEANKINSIIIVKVMQQEKK
jgi:hypothetical protein